jgi:outer membrane scaffolding protein for murein synthesis (MipA/OmpV family)
MAAESWASSAMRLPLALRRWLLCWFVLLAPLAAQSSAPATYSNILGAALRLRPAYDGSSDERVDVIPIIDFTHGIVFARTIHGVFEGGAHFPVGAGWTAGVQLAWEESRKARESGLLRARGVPDRSVGVSFGPHVEWRGSLGASPVLVIGRVRQQIDTDRGLQADLRATAGLYRGGPVLAGAFVQATWASDKAMRTYFGQPGFNPDGGLLFTSIGLLGSWDLSPRWALFGSAENRWLNGDARRSPLTERETSFYTAGGIGYRF